MVLLKDILDAICARLAAAYQYPVYTDDIPQDAQRPGFMVEILNRDAVDHTRWTESVTVTARITAFAAEDSHGSAPQAEVLQLLQGAQSLFGPSLPVGDRFLRIKATGRAGLSDAPITLTITYMDDRDERPEYENMAIIKTKIETEEQNQ